MFLHFLWFWFLACFHVACLDRSAFRPRTPVNHTSNPQASSGEATDARKLDISSRWLENDAQLANKTLTVNALKSKVTSVENQVSPGPEQAPTISFPKANVSAMHNQTTAWTDFGSPWLEKDTQLTKKAVQRGLKFMSNLTTHGAHVVLNTVSFFTELVETSADPQVREAARELAVKAARTMEHRMLRSWRRGTFGLLLGTRHDVIEGLQLLRYQADLGLIQPKARATNGSLLSAIHEVWLYCDSCRSAIAPSEGESGSATGAAKQYLRLLDGVVGASVVDEGSFLFGFNAPGSLLAQAFANALAPFCVPDDITPGSADWRAKAYLATHVVFVAAGFDRFPVPAGYVALDNVLAWIQGASLQALTHVDDTDHGTELLSEFAAALKAANATEKEDVFVRKATRILLQRQHEDGRWGLQKEGNDAAEDYNVLHHVWTAMSALRSRGQVANPYAQHLTKEIRKGCRLACNNLGVGAATD